MPILTTFGSTVYPLSDFSFSDSRFDRWKRFSVSIADLYSQSPIYSDKAEKIQGCGNFLIFKRVSPDQIRLQNAHFCRQRYCPLCAWRKRRKWINRIMEALEIFSSSHDFKVIFLTLAQRNCLGQDLSKELKKISKAWSKLVDIKKKSSYGLDFPFSYLRTYEITRRILADGTSDYHPHIHALLFVPNNYFDSDLYIDFKSRPGRLGWLDRWQAALDVDYLPTAHVKAINNDLVYKGVYQVTKYCLKPASFYNRTATSLRPSADVESLDILTSATHGLRSVSVGGSFRKCFQGLSDPLPDVDDTEEVADIGEDEDLIKLNENNLTSENGKDMITFKFVSDWLIPGLSSYLLTDNFGNVFQS